MADRPILVSIIGGLTLLAAFLVIAIAIISYVAPDIFTDLDIDPSITEYFGIGGLIIGIITLIIGLAIWRGWTIAWYIAVILYALAVLGSIVTIVTGGYVMIVSLAITLLILYYLFRPKVKEFFGV